MPVTIGMYSLEPHPAARPDAVGSVSCSPIWEDVSNWVLDFYVSEPPGALFIPEPRPPARADGLWQTTCFEIFLQREGREDYFEFNFSPSGQWAAYHFDGYRRNVTALDVPHPLIEGSNEDQVRLAFQARYQRRGMDPESIELFLASLPLIDQRSVCAMRVGLEDAGFATGGPWRAGISAVIEEANGTKSYWALNHPSDKPDFHHPDSFVLELP